jgi:hypothetical protein
VGPTGAGNATAPPAIWALDAISPPIRAPARAACSRSPQAWALGINASVAKQKAALRIDFDFITVLGLGS